MCSKRPDFRTGVQWKFNASTPKIKVFKNKTHNLKDQQLCNKIFVKHSLKRKRTPCVLNIFDHVNCALVGYYAANIGKSLPTFRSNLSVPYSVIKNKILDL